MSSGSLSCCSPAFCCCCCCVWWWWWFMLAAVVVVMRSSRLSLSPSTLSTVASAGNRFLDCWWGVVGYGGGVDRSSLGGRACSAATSALSAVSAGDWGGEVGGGAGRETRTYLLAIRPISTPLVVDSHCLTAGWGGTGGSPCTDPRRLFAKSILFYPGKCGVTGKHDFQARVANSLFTANLALSYLTLGSQPLMKVQQQWKQRLIWYNLTFNNFDCDVPNPCVPPSVPRLGESGGKSYPFKTASSTEYQ